MKEFTPKKDLTKKAAWIRENGLSGAALKWIALIAMVVDHVAVTFVPETSGNYMILRIVGRISFPIFAFLASEGIIHSRNLVKYALSLLAFAVISEIPYDLLFYGQPFYWGSQNVMFTLAFAVGYMALWAKAEGDMLWTWIAMGVAVGIYFLLTYMNAEYGVIGVLMVFLFYFLRKMEQARLFIVAAAIVFFYQKAPVELWSIAALVFLFFYSGKRGKNLPKYFFYAFYPAHLLLLWGLKMAL